MRRIGVPNGANIPVGSTGTVTSVRCGGHWIWVDWDYGDGTDSYNLTDFLEKVEYLEKVEPRKTGFGRAAVTYEDGTAEVGEIWRFDYPDSSNGDLVTRMVKITAIYEDGGFLGQDLVRDGEYRRFKRDKVQNPVYQMTVDV